MSRVTVLLPLVPADRDDRDPPVGVADPRRRRGPGRGDALGPARERAAPGRRSARAVRDGETSRSARAKAASAMARARSAPTHGKVTIQWPGSDERWTAQPAAALVVLEPRSRRTQRGDGGHAVRPVASRDRRPEVDQGVAARVALAVPGPPPADGDLELDHRLEPVDVRSFEQADLDESHGPGRIASAPSRLDWRGMTSIDRPHPPRPATAELDGLRAAHRADLPAYLADLERLVNIDCGSYTRRASTRSGAGWPSSCDRAGRHRRASARPGGRLGDTVVGTFDGQAGGPRALLIGHMDTVFDPGTAAERPFRIEDGVAYGPGVTDMKGGPAGRAVRAEGARSASAAACRSSGWSFVANPDEEIGSPTSTPLIRDARGRRRRRARPRVRPGQRRHRQLAQGHRRPAARRSTAGRPTPASSPRRAAARSSRPPRSSRTSTRSTAAGRASPSTSGSSPAGRARTWWPSECPLEVDLRAVRRDGARGGRGRDPRGSPRATVVPDTTVEVERDGPLVADGEARALRPARRARAGASPARSASSSRDAATGGASDANTTSGHGRARASTGSARSAATITPRRSTSSVDSIVPADDAAGGPAAGDRGRSGGRRLARRARRARRWRPGATADLGMTERRLISSGGPYEAAVGYSRAVVVGDSCWVAGTTDAGPDGRSRHPGDPVPRRGRRSRSSSAALAEAGFALADVVRTRMFVTDIADRRGRARGPRRDLRRDPAGGHDGRGLGADRAEPARRDRGRRAARLNAAGSLQLGF